MFNLQAIANIFTNQNLPELHTDAFNFAYDLILDGMYDALNCEENYVCGYFTTMSDDVYIDIMFLPETNETVFTIGGGKWQTIVTIEISDAIDHLYDCLVWQS